MRDAPRPLVLLAQPRSDGTAGRYASLVERGRAVLGDELAERFGSAGARVERLAAAPPNGFRWGAWFAAAARRALDTSPHDVLAYASAGSLPLASDRAIARLVSPAAGWVVANNRFSGDAFGVAGDVARAIDVLEGAPSDNAAPRCLADAGWRVRDFSASAFARADVDTPQDLALLAVAATLDGARPMSDAVSGFLRSSAPGIPRVDELAAVVVDRRAELVVAGRVATSTARYLERQTACRVRLFVEERGMRSGAGVPRSLLGRALQRDGARALVTELAGLGDAVVLDTRVLMGAIAGSPDPATWPPPEERFASDALDADAIGTDWLGELTQAAAQSRVPVILGGHFLLNDGLRILVQAGWESPRPRVTTG